MSSLDWLIVSAYAAVIIGIGVVANRKQKDTDSFFRGSRKLPWWAIGISIIATAFSAASLLGGPGEGYGHGFLWLQLQLGDLLGYALVLFLFLPIFVKLDITTAYDYLERRFDARARTLGALCFLFFIVARLGALLYGASLVVAKVAHVPLPTAILLVGTVSVAYTCAGGIAAVIWTDVLQFGMILVGVGVGLWTAVHGVPGGTGELWAVAGEAGKLEVFDFTWDPSSIRTFPTAFFAYGILAFAVAGTNQQSVQRYVSCKNVKDGQKAAFLAWFAGFVGVAATLLLGVFLYAFYSASGTALPEDVAGDKILPHFIVNEVPVGAAGLLVAAIFAAAMSSIDSALHSLSTSMTVDFYQRFWKKTASEKHYLKVAQGLIVLWGAAGIASAFYVASTGESLLPFLVKYTALFLGPVLGLFLMGMLIPRVNAAGAFWGTVAAALILIVGVELKWISFPGIWRGAFAAPLAVVLGLGISLLGKAPSKEKLKGLTV